MQPQPKLSNYVGAGIAAVIVALLGWIGHAVQETSVGVARIDASLVAIADRVKRLERIHERGD